MHTPTHRANESRVEYNARLAASLCLKNEQEDDECATRRALHRQQELRDEAEVLCQEQEEYDAECVWREEESEPLHKPSE